jgi:hypothetical protein
LSWHGCPAGVHHFGCACAGVVRAAGAHAGTTFPRTWVRPCCTYACPHLSLNTSRAPSPRRGSPDTLPPHEHGCSTGLLVCTSVRLPSTVPAGTAAPRGVGTYCERTIPSDHDHVLRPTLLPLTSLGGHRQGTRGDIDPRHPNRMAVSQMDWSSCQPPRPPVLSIECCIRRIRI